MSASSIARPPSHPIFDVETLAIFLAVGSDHTLKGKAEMIVAWSKKHEDFQEAYRRRARRLMRTWRKP